MGSVCSKRGRKEGKVNRFRQYIEGGRGGGYLIASSQGSDNFMICQRGGTNAYVATFAIVAGNGIDRVTHTDGIDVSNFGLGSPFEQGIFVAQAGIFHS